MATDQLDYNRMVQRALRSVVRSALDYAGEHGMPGNHHFYISFRTDDSSVEIPDHLRARYPEEMTIVMQHKFWGLETNDDGFAVTLSFNRVNERLVIPFDALTGFMDPSVQFGLQFKSPDDAEPGDGLPAATGGSTAVIERPDTPPPVPVPAGKADAADGQGSADDEAGDANIVSLDNFRKK